MRKKLFAVLVILGIVTLLGTSQNSSMQDIEQRQQQQRIDQLKAHGGGDLAASQFNEQYGAKLIDANNRFNDSVLRFYDVYIDNATLASILGNNWNLTRYVADHLRTAQYLPKTESEVTCMAKLLDGIDGAASDPAKLKELTVRLIDLPDPVYAAQALPRLEADVAQLSKTLHAFANAETFQRTPTPDGLNQTVHPSVLYFPEAWRGWKYWMAITSYANGNPRDEEPSILVGNDTATKTGGSWQTPNGLKNPIIKPPYGGFYADPELVYNDDTNELWLYYKSYDGGAAEVKLSLLRSSDGVHWTKPQSLISWSGKSTEGRSYSIVKQHHNWDLWYQRGNKVYRVEHRHSNNGLSWSSPSNVTFTHNAQPWHLQVRYIPNMKEYWMLFCASKNGVNYTSPGGSLYLAKSADRENWVTMERPVLTVNPHGWDSDRIYRSTFVYDPSTGVIHLWYSARSRFQWYTGYTSIEYPSAYG